MAHLSDSIDLSDLSGNTGNSFKMGSFDTDTLGRTGAAPSSETPMFVDTPIKVPSGQVEKPSRNWEILLGTPAIRMGQYFWTLILKKAAPGTSNGSAGGAAPAPEEFSYEMECSCKQYTKQWAYTVGSPMMAALVNGLDAGEGASFLDQIGGSESYKRAIARHLADIAAAELYRVKGSGDPARMFRVFPRS